MASAGSAANANAAAKFWDHFQEQKECIKSMVASNQDASQHVRDLDEALREAFIYLPTYDQKHFIKDLEELRGLLHKRNEPKRFGFRFKNASTKPNRDKPAAAPTASPENTNSKSADAEAGNGASVAVDQPASSTSSNKASLYTFADIKNEWVEARPEPLCARKAGMLAAAEPTDGELRDISDSVLDLRRISGSLRALNCHRIKNSVVICDPFSGSATIRDSQNCIFVMGVRQLRLENSRMVDVYVYCTSHPIIEKSSGVSFSAYPAAVETDETRSAFAHSKLSEMPDLHHMVDDFNWLKRQPSPNWSVHNRPLGKEDWALVNGSERALGRIKELLPAARTAPDGDLQGWATWKRRLGPRQRL
ncbi:hypothetical protein GQ54DRAFT_257481 [Martensiomyces pterosporus]|nr:hypothetical protein GQ54DRAFT_257481 [Martensiomyces pterosporus]